MNLSARDRGGTSGTGRSGRWRGLRGGSRRARPYSVAS